MKNKIISLILSFALILSVCAISSATASEKEAKEVLNK